MPSDPFDYVVLWWCGVLWLFVVTLAPIAKAAWRPR